MTPSDQKALIDAVFGAVWACSHSITAERVVLHHDQQPAGLNARAQLRYRIDTALHAIRGQRLGLSLVPDSFATDLDEAVLSCGHSINHSLVRLNFDPKREGHNALNQLHRRIEAAVLDYSRGCGATATL